MRLSEPRVSTIVDEETGTTLVKTTWDNSHDVGGQNYEFTFYDEGGVCHSFEVRTQYLGRAYKAYKEKNPQIRGFSMPGVDTFTEAYYRKNHTEHQVLWFVDQPPVENAIYDKAARAFCDMFLRLEFSYEFNHEEYVPGEKGGYLGKIHFYPSPKTRTPSFEMEVG